MPLIYKTNALVWQLKTNTKVNKNAYKIKIK